MSSLILQQKGLATLLTLKRPPINALDGRALEEFPDAVAQVKANSEPRVLIITGGIDGIFCSGGDLKYWRQVHNGNEVSHAGREVFAQIEQLPKPTIAAINGHVIGDGLALALALACDLRVASMTATFRLPGATYGFIPGWGLIHRLVSFIGRSKASELLLPGQPVDATRAWSMGLVNEVVPSDKLVDNVLERANQMAALSPAAIGAAKCALLGGNESACFESVWDQDGWREGIDALLAKRTPEYGPAGKDVNVIRLDDDEAANFQHFTAAKCRKALTSVKTNYFRR